MLNILIASPITEAIDRTRSVVDSLAQTDNNTMFQAIIDMQILADLIDCIPMDQSEYCYFHNRVNSTEDLLDRNEVNAAKYQLREMNRKLIRLKANSDA